MGGTSLPQAVAAFHSLVGFAAVFTAIGDYAAHAGSDHMDGVHLTGISLATAIGGVTATAPSWPSGSSTATWILQPWPFQAVIPSTSVWPPPCLVRWACSAQTHRTELASPPSVRPLPCPVLLAGT